jgi:L-ascorbate metabolism protein UlaG (beta-lactamase superfamily)
MIENIKWLGHGSFLIQGSPIIYINPWKISRRVFHADLILITHDHYEHFSQADVEKLRGPDTLVVSNSRVAEELDGTTVLRPWHSLTVDRASIKAVPAYSPDSLAHPIENGGLGFVISLNFYDIYYAGDTQIIPEMDQIHPDIAILPIDGNGTLTIEEAAKVTRKMRPRWVIPSNWNDRPDGATSIDALQFRDLVGDTSQVIIPVLQQA